MRRLRIADCVSVVYMSFTKQNPPSVLRAYATLLTQHPKPCHHRYLSLRKQSSQVQRPPRLTQPTTSHLADEKKEIYKGEIGGGSEERGGGDRQNLYQGNLFVIQS